MVDEFVCFIQPEFQMENLQFNYSKNTDFVDMLKNDSSPQFWLKEFDAKWNQKECSPNAETLTKHGIGFTFNLNDDILNLDL